MGNPVVKWQIVARDPANVAEFYSKLFGWSVDTDNALGYRELRSGDGRGIDGGVWPSPPEGHDLVQLFVEVDDIDATLDSLKTLGGRVIIPKQTLPDGDSMAIALDPAGLSFGLVESGKT